MNTGRENQGKDRQNEMDASLETIQNMTWAEIQEYNRIKEEEFEKRQEEFLKRLETDKDLQREAAERYRASLFHHETPEEKAKEEEITRLLEEARREEARRGLKLVKG